MFYKFNPFVSFSRVLGTSCELCLLYFERNDILKFDYFIANNDEGWKKLLKERVGCHGTVKLSIETHAEIKLF